MGPFVAQFLILFILLELLFLGYETYKELFFYQLLYFHLKLQVKKKFYYGKQKFMFLFRLGLHGPDSAPDPSLPPW